MKRLYCILLVLCLLAPLTVACRSEAELTIVNKGECVIVYDTATVSKELAEVKRELRQALQKEGICV